MEAKELKIQVPEGYEIDKENSTFECIKFKLIRNDITYKDICKKLYKWNADTLELEKAVPKFKSKFKPFDKVLVRDDLNEEWSINLFSYYDKEDGDFPYVCISGRYEYCIPYEGNEYFVGKTINIKKI